MSASTLTSKPASRDMDARGGLRPRQPVGDDVLDDLHEERDLGVTAPLPVLRRAHEHGHVPDPGPLAPVQDVLDVLGPVPVPQAGTGQSQLPCPAAAAVHDQPDVPGQRDTGQLPAQLTGDRSGRGGRVAGEGASRCFTTHVPSRGADRRSPATLPGRRIGHWHVVEPQRRSAVRAPPIARHPSTVTTSNDQQQPGQHEDCEAR